MGTLESQLDECKGVVRHSLGPVSVPVDILVNRLSNNRSVTSLPLAETRCRADNLSDPSTPLICIAACPRAREVAGGVFNRC